MIGMIFASLLWNYTICSTFVERKEHRSNKYEYYDNDTLQTAKTIHWQ